MHSAVPFAIVNGNTTSPPPSDLTAAVCAAYAAAVHCSATCCQPRSAAERANGRLRCVPPADRIRIAAVCAAHAAAPSTTAETYAPVRRGSRQPRAVDARTPSGAVSDLRHAESRSAAERAEQSGSGRGLKGLGFKASGLAARDFAAGTSLAEASIRTARLRRRRPRPRRPRRRRPVMRGPRQVTIGSTPCTAPLRAAPSGWWCAARSWAAHAALPGPESAAHRGPYAFEPSCYYE